VASILGDKDADGILERLARAGVATIPDGVYEASSFMDDDGVPYSITILGNDAGKVRTKERKQLDRYLEAIRKNRSPGDAEAGEAFEEIPLASDKGVEPRIAAKHRPQGLQGAKLEGQDPIAVDDRFGAEPIRRAHRVADALEARGDEIGRLAGSDALRGLGVQVFWIAALSLAANALWRRAIRRVVIQGG